MPVQVCGKATPSFGKSRNPRPGAGEEVSPPAYFDCFSVYAAAALQYAGSPLRYGVGDCAQEVRAQHGASHVGYTADFCGPSHAFRAVLPVEFQLFAPTAERILRCLFHFPHQFRFHSGTRAGRFRSRTCRSAP